ncbi:MAG: phosphatase domain-containing protein [Bacteriovoracaceae bacterium]
MKRPYLVNFAAISADDNISVKASVTDSNTPLIEKREGKKSAPTSPIQSIGLISSDEYRIKIEGFGARQQKIYNREFDSDRFGIFDLKLPRTIAGEEIEKLQVYETSYRPGLELLMGSYLPYKIKKPKKIIISDFDKTLVDTKYSTALEMYQSLRRPLNYFPTVEKSVELFAEYSSRGFQPFILSASPHFYENAIRDWLYQNKFYAGNIFLKDYRNIFSFTDGLLTPKDLKRQSFYKLNQLVNILIMTGIPEELVLMGDSFESDEDIYLVLASILVSKNDPWKVWNAIKKERSFRLTTKQNFHFLSKFYQLGEMGRSAQVKNLKIHIRCNEKNYRRTIKNAEEHSGPKAAPFDFIQDEKDLVNYYLG